jgi:hypothetical protein
MTGLLKVGVAFVFLFSSYSALNAEESQFALLDKTGRQQRRAERRGEKVPDAATGAPEAPSALVQFQYPFAPRGLDLQTTLREVDRALSLYSRHYLRADTASPWEVVHGLLGLGADFRLFPSGNSTEPSLKALDWLFAGARHGGAAAFERTKWGARGRPYEPHGGAWVDGMEGHPNQFLGYLSELNLPLSTELLALDGSRWVTVTLQDVVNDAKAQVGSNPTKREPYELTWTLWGLSHYVAPAERWTNFNNQDWNVAGILAREIDAPIVGVTSCGGTHRAYAIAYALEQQVLRYGSVAPGIYEKANQYVAFKVSQLKQFQNEDGSLSANYFFGPAMADSWAKRLASNGHQLEFLMRALTPAGLDQEWVRRAAYTVALDLVMTQNSKLSLGAVYHAVHALRMFKAKLPAPIEVN